MTSKQNPRSEKVDIDLDDAYEFTLVPSRDPHIVRDTDFDILNRLRVKLKTISDQFDTRELHYKSLLRCKDLEIQTVTAKFEEQRRTADNESSRGRALSAQVSTFSHTEAELRSQLNIYVEKFKQVRKHYIYLEHYFR